MIKIIKTTGMFIVAALLTQTAYSGNGQSFDGINYINPANDLFVDKLRLAAGTLVYNSKIPFNGTVRGNPKDVTSDPIIASPYGRIIYRVNPKFAVGLALSEPFRVVYDFTLTNPDFPGLNDFNNIRSASIHPNVGYKLFENLWLGGGLFYTNYRAHANIVVPFTISPTPLVASFEGSGDAWSYVLGGIFFFKKGTFLDVSYYSRSRSKIWGTSSINDLSAPTLVPTIFQIPNTWDVSITHSLTKKIMIRVGMSRTYWSEFKQSNVYIAGNNVNIPLGYHDTNRFNFLGRYELNDKYAFSIYAVQDFTPTDLGRTNFALAGNIVSTGIIASKQMTKTLTLRGLVGYAFNTSKLLIAEERFQTFGTTKNRILATNIQITYEK